jgi:hypothetical protein
MEWVAHTGTWIDQAVDARDAFFVAFIGRGKRNKRPGEKCGAIFSDVRTKRHVHSIGAYLK